MDNTMTKEQVVEATIALLGRIKVPVAMKEEITDPLVGAINNLLIVLQMIKKEKELSEKNGDDADVEHADPE